MDHILYKLIVLSLLTLCNGQQQISIASIQITFSNMGNYTNFVLKSYLGYMPVGWMGVGLNFNRKMGGASVVVCKFGDNGNAIEHYYNQGHNPIYLDSSNPTIGLKNMNISVENSVYKCSFSRDNSNSNPNYFQVDSNTQSCYMLGAYGDIYSDSSLKEHISKGSTSVIIQAGLNNNATDKLPDAEKIDYLLKAKIHGSLMIIAWIFFSTTGIILARYYKELLPNMNCFNISFWFHIHRPFMILASLISIIAFIVILTYLDWTWTEQDDLVSFTHSIFGIVTISLSVVQVFVAFFRPSPDHVKRYIFTYFHRAVGISTYLCAMVAIFLGLNIIDFDLNDKGWGVMLGWVFWIVFLPAVLEIFYSCYPVDSVNSALVVDTFKLVLLFLHVFISIGTTTALVVLISLSS